ncbi:hypothetical protein ACLMJK_006937 [Lecanora helva]
MICSQKLRKPSLKSATGDLEKTAKGGAADQQEYCHAHPTYDSTTRDEPDAIVSLKCSPKRFLTRGSERNEEFKIEYNEERSKG